MSREYNTVMQPPAATAQGTSNLISPLTQSLTTQASRHPAVVHCHLLASKAIPPLVSIPAITQYHIPSLTSLALCCIRISLSISCTCCSSLKASAHGTPNSSALVLTTHNVLPVRLNPDAAQS